VADFQGRGLILKMIATSGFLTALECTKGKGKGQEGKGRERTWPLRKFLDPPLSF